MFLCLRNSLNFRKMLSFKDTSARGLIGLREFLGSTSVIFKRKVVLKVISWHHGCRGRFQATINGMRMQKGPMFYLALQNLRCPWLEMLSSVAMTPRALSKSFGVYCAKWGRTLFMGWSKTSRIFWLDWEWIHAYMFRKGSAIVLLCWARFYAVEAWLELFRGLCPSGTRQAHFGPIFLSILALHSRGIWYPPAQGENADDWGTSWHQNLGEGQQIWIKKRKEIWKA
jgi:hypothetical protein